MKKTNQKKIIARATQTKTGVTLTPLFGNTDPAPEFIGLTNSPPVGSIVEAALTRGDDPEKINVEHWELLARPGGALALIYDLLEKYRLNPLFSEEITREVADIQANPGIDDPALEDMTALAFVTIDNQDSRDLDQAIQINRGKNEKEYIVRYALADASYYVKPGTALLEEAVKRGVTYYLPGFSVPMLPRELSEGIISLNPGVDRRAVVFVMTLDRDTKAVSTELVRAKVRSRAKLSYPGVQEYYDNPGASPLAGKEYTEVLDLLQEVGDILIADANERDVVRFTRVELDVGIAADDSAFTLQKDNRNDTSFWNEQISLLCNREGARLLRGPRLLRG
ncbi:MAG: RNB domain-containing ribonuclease, partial [bacterium]|nr:RNB domain-containing ribonuclease [bacterium]